MTTTDFERRIAQANPGLRKGKVQRLANRISKRAAAMQEQFDFFAELRILGVIADPTARNAVKNIEAHA